jgi:predicted phosphodiesterase
MKADKTHRNNHPHLSLTRTAAALSFAAVVLLTAPSPQVLLLFPSAFGIEDNNNNIPTTAVSLTESNNNGSSATSAAANGSTGTADFNIAAVGDWGCTSNTEDTVDNIISKSPEVVIGLGDNAYQIDVDCWFDIVEPIDDIMKNVIGNHDIEDGHLDEILEHYNDDYQSKQYYAFSHENVQIIVMSTEVDYSAGSAQHIFVESELDDAVADPSIDWIIVAMHRQMYGSPTGPVDHPESGLRDAYHPLFQKYGVDLVLYGHNHNYERTYPLNYSSDDDTDEPFITTREATNYLNPDGQIFITIGTGGEDSFGFHDRQPYVVSQFDEGFGFLDITITDGGKRLVGTFYDNDGGELRDQFEVIKEGEDEGEGSGSSNGNNTTTN